MAKNRCSAAKQYAPSSGARRHIAAKPQKKSATQRVNKGKNQEQSLKKATKSPKKSNPIPQQLKKIIAPLAAKRHDPPNGGHCGKPQNEQNRAHKTYTPLPRVCNAWQKTLSRDKTAQ